MDDPEAYKTTSALRADNHAQLIDEFTSKFNWRSDGKDSVLDIGCAGGNVTTSLILPKLPSTFSRLIGVDINDNMVNYATKNYQISKVSFIKLDIGGDISEFIRKYGTFDHIISLFCFHLVPDQRLAIKNVYNLLGTNGDCFLHILSEFSGFDIYKRMYRKWSEYMLDIDDFVSPYFHRIDPVYMLKKHLGMAGFKASVVEEKRKAIAYHDVQSFIGAFVPVIPFFSRLPLKKRDEFLDEYVKLSMEVKPEPGMKVENCKPGQDVNIFVIYKCSIAHAKK